MTLQDLLNKGKQILSFKEIQRSKYEALIIYSKINNFQPLDYYLYKDKKVSQKQIKIFLKKIYQRSLGKPFAKIFGKKEFYSRDFFVNFFTLCPRPETELIVDIIKKIEVGDKKLKILDLGTGSGCLLISLILELKKNNFVFGTGIDRCKEAIRIAFKNAKYYEIEKHLEFFESFWFSNVKRKYDIIVSNPPYIERKEIENLPDSVKKFDPLIALDGGVEGLDGFREIAKSVKKFLNPRGYICLEIGYNQKKEVRKIFEKEKFILVNEYKDYGDKDRVIIFKNKI